MVKLVLNNGQYKVTIPKELAKAKGLKAGSTVRFVEKDDGTIVLKFSDGDVL